MEPGAALLSVYIEGDGLPWATRTELSDDPSPRSARVLKLAVQDNAMNAAYLARPCQYLPTEVLVVCPSNTWSFGRYGEDMVVALDQAIDVLKEPCGHPRHPPHRLFGRRRPCNDNESDVNGG